MKLHHKEAVEGKAKIEDHAEMLHSKVTLLKDIQEDHAHLKAQCAPSLRCVCAPWTGGLGWKLALDGPVLVCVWRKERGLYGGIHEFSCW